MDAKLNPPGHSAPTPADETRGAEAPATDAPAAPTPRDVVVIGASAGGVEALKAVLGALPADYDGTICVVLHIPPTVPSVLAHILGRSTRLVCVSAYDGAPVRPGVIYVAPPDYHLLLDDGRVRLLRGPRENGHRPAIDPLFRSAAEAYGPRAVGVVLTGNLDDGTRGLFAIKHRGGLAVAQAPWDAPYPSMPQNAVEHVAVDYVLPSFEIGPLLAAVAKGELPSASHPEPGPDAIETRDALGDIAALELAGGPPQAHPEHVFLDPSANGAANGAKGVTNGGGNGAPNGAANGAANGTNEPAARVPGGDDLRTGIGRVDGGARVNESLGGSVSAYTCPDCHGALWEVAEGNLLVRYRCRVGHSFTEPGLVDNKARAVEDALWTALTALEESAAIAARVADRAALQGRQAIGTTFRQRAKYLERRGAVLRDLLTELPGHVDGT